MFIQYPSPNSDQAPPPSSLQMVSHNHLKELHHHPSSWVSQKLESQPYWPTFWGSYPTQRQRFLALPSEPARTPFIPLCFCCHYSRAGPPVSSPGWWQLPPSWSLGNPTGLPRRCSEHNGSSDLSKILTSLSASSLFRTLGYYLTATGLKIRLLDITPRASCAGFLDCLSCLTSKPLPLHLPCPVTQWPPLVPFF